MSDVLPLANTCHRVNMAISAEEDVLKQRMLCNFRSVNGFIFVVVIYSPVESIRFTALVTSWYLFILSRPYYISNDVGPTQNK